MNSEKLSINQQKVAFIGGIIMILVNIGALAWNIHQTNLQIAETRSLAKLTAQLDHRVHKLEASLDHKVTRLNRLNELLRGIYFSNMRIIQKAKVLSEVYGADTLSRDTYLEHITIEELAEREVTVHWSLVEMTAIAEVIGDSDLTRAIADLTNSFPKWPIGLPPDEFIESYNKYLNSAKELHHKIYTLLQELTNAPDL